MPKIDELTFQRVVDPAIVQIIPRYLFEQLEKVSAEQVDMLYAYASDMLTLPAVNHLGQVVRVANPLIWFAVLHDVAHQIKGFLWVKINIIGKHLYVQAFSVDKEYQDSKGSINKKMLDYLFGLPIPDEFKQKVTMEVTRPKAAEKRGWERSKRVLMEVNNVPKTKDKKTDDKSK